MQLPFVKRPIAGSSDYSSKMSVVAATVLLSTACGTWVGSPKNPGDSQVTAKAAVSLDIRGTANEQALTAVALAVTNSRGDVSGSITLTRADLVLKEIKFKPTDASESSKDAYDFKGPFVVDLITNKTTPEPGTAELPAGTYREVLLKMAKLDEESKESSGIAGYEDMVDLSLKIEGVYVTAGGDTRQLDLEMEFGEEFEISGDDLMEFITAGVNKAYIEFGMPSWFDFSRGDKEVDFESVADADIILTRDARSESAKNLRELIKENIKASAKAGKERD